MDHAIGTDAPSPVAGSRPTRRSLNYERPSLNELCKRITVDIFAQCSGCLHREVEDTRHDVSTHDMAERLKKAGWQVSIVTDGLLCPTCAADLQRKACPHLTSPEAQA